MSRCVQVHSLPERVQQRELRGAIAVVIDVLRASTTIVHALDAGAKSVIPCRSPNDARALAAGLANEQVLLGGERRGVLIEGFDLDNSPLRYTPDAVDGKTIVFTTTNGTRALMQCESAERVLIGAFVNLNALIGSLANNARSVHLVCAGTHGEISSEDILCAGAIALGIRSADAEIELAGRSTAPAMADYQTRSHSRHSLYEAVCASPGGRDLLALGFERDVRRAVEWDLFDLVPEYCAETGRIKPGRASGLTGRVYLTPPADDTQHQEAHGKEHGSDCRAV